MSPDGIALFGSIYDTVSLMLPSTTEIEYFLEVYKFQHVSKAAVRLGVTQPTLTLSLQKLEEKLGSKLFHRTKQGVVPTEQGTLFYQKSLLLMDCWSDVQRTIYSSISEIAGRYKVGCHPSVGAYLLPSFLGRLYQQAPGIEIDLIHDFSRKITESIISYSIDIAFVVNPSRHPDLVLKKLGDDRVLYWKNPKYQSLPKRIFADLNLLQTEEILRKTQTKVFRDWKVLGTSSLELIRTLTLNGQGIGILPQRVAQAEGSELIPFDSNLANYDDRVYLIYRKEVLASKAGRELIRLASIELPKLP